MLSNGTKINDLGWPWTSLSSNFLETSRDFADLGGNSVKQMKIDLYCQWQNCTPLKVPFSNILIAYRWFAVDYFARGLHARTAVTQLPLHLLGFLVNWNVKLHSCSSRTVQSLIVLFANCNDVQFSLKINCCLSCSYHIACAVNNEGVLWDPPGVPTYYNLAWVPHTFGGVWPLLTFTYFAHCHTLCMRSRT